MTKNSSVLVVKTELHGYSNFLAEIFEPLFLPFLILHFSHSNNTSTMFITIMLVCLLELLIDIVYLY